MTTKIGFITEPSSKMKNESVPQASVVEAVPKKSIVQVYFSERNMSLSYYNCRFDLHKGDIVYVDGKLEGMLGRVTDVNYNFKINPADYKQIIAVVDTTVHGQLFISNYNFITFDSTAMPASKILTWFKPPAYDAEYVRGYDDRSFSLNDLSGMNISDLIKGRGKAYYIGRRVKYLSLEGSKGYAIVIGSEAYEVEFEYINGEISHLTCSCFCSYNCKHEYAAMLLLDEVLKLIEKQYSHEFEKNSYFAVIDKDLLLNFSVMFNNSGSITL